MSSAIKKVDITASSKPGLKRKMMTFYSVWLWWRLARILWLKSDSFTFPCPSVDISACSMLSPSQISHKTRFSSSSLKLTTLCNATFNLVLYSSELRLEGRVFCFSFVNCCISWSFPRPLVKSRKIWDQLFRLAEYLLICSLLRARCYSTNYIR